MYRLPDCQALVNHCQHLPSSILVFLVVLINSIGVLLPAKNYRRIQRPSLLANSGQLLTLRSTADGPRRGASLSELGIIQDAAVLCAGGKIVSVGTTREALSDPWLKKNRKKIVEIDCAGRVVLPGFVDSHTHPVFTHPRLI